MIAYKITNKLPLKNTKQTQTSVNEYFKSFFLFHINSHPIKFML